MYFQEILASLDGAYEIRDTEFTDCVYAGEARQLIFSGVTFMRCRFPEADLSGCEFSGCTFISCDFSGARLGDTYFSRCTLRSVKAVGTHFTRAILRDVTIHGCVMTLANFSGAKWDHVTAEQSQFGEASLAEIQMRGAAITECDLRRAEIFRTSLKGMDLRDCQLDGIALSESMWELRGATVDETQAAALVRRMGVIVR